MLIPCCLWSRSKAPQASSAPLLSPPGTVGLWPGPRKLGLVPPAGRKKRGCLCFSEWQLQSPEPVALRHPEVMLGLLGSAAFGL